ncbi:MAG: ribonuclease P protein component, partial [Muribaculaceae bacterium]|nr:ribonuclease P protein component [Muribaculaceae bacterium]
MPTQPDTLKINLSFRKPEKLRHKKLVDALFSKGKNIYDFPLRLVWRKITPDELKASFRDKIPEKTGKLQMLVTIPKKKRRHAVDRVLLRRRIREAYRLNRLPLADVINNREDIGTLSIAFIYLGTENISYSEIEKRMINLLSRLEKKISSKSEAAPAKSAEAE